MREIKFRGKTAYGKWLYGNLGKSIFHFRDLTSTSLVIFDNLQSFNTDNYGFVVQDLSVDEYTVGQFSGKYDKHKKEIYEDDIVLQVGYNNKLVPMLVRFENGAFIVGYHNGSSTRNTPMLLSSKCEVIGNKYDNPELLKEDK